LRFTKLLHFIFAMAPNKPWYVYWNPPYEGNEPNFFDSEKLEWTALIENNWAKISNELHLLIKEKEGKFQPYFVSGLDENSQGWQTLTLKTWGIDVKQNQQKCPQTMQILNKVEGCVSVAVSLLLPNTKIHPHAGDTNAIYRCHVGIDVPTGLPDCGFQVKNEQQAWANGKALVFCDAYEHNAWNNTSHPRHILILDVIREEFLNQKKSICLHVRAFLLFQLLIEKMKWILKLPKWMQHTGFFKIKLLLWLIYPIQKKTGVLLKHE